MRPTAGSRLSTPRNSTSACSSRIAFSACGPTATRNAPQQTARDDEIDERGARQQHGHIQRIRDDVDRIELEPAHLPRDLGGRGARIEDDRFTFTDEFERCRGDAHFFGAMQRLLDVDRHLVAVASRQRAAVDAHDRADFVECREVAADRDRRDGKLARELGHGDLRPFLDQVADAAAPLFERERRIGVATGRDSTGRDRTSI
jgi:hypothetical protein